MKQSKIGQNKFFFFIYGDEVQEEELLFFDVIKIISR